VLQQKAYRAIRPPINVKN